MLKGHLLVVLAVLAAMAGLVLISWTTDGPSAVKDGKVPPVVIGYEAPAASRAAPSWQAQLEEALTRTLSGATLRGHMGRRQKREIEAVSPDTPYRLGNVARVDNEGRWKLEYYIPGTDLLFDMPPVKVEWAGDLPVITITDLQIKGKKGTFRARILIDGDRYSGTWSDGKSNGCLFGVIVNDNAAPDRET